MAAPLIKLSKGAFGALGNFAGNLNNLTVDPDLGRAATVGTGLGFLGKTLLDANTQTPSGVTQPALQPAPTAPAPPAPSAPSAPGFDSSGFADLLKKYQTDFETSQAVIAQQNIQFQQNFDRQQKEFNAVLENEKKRLFENSRKTSGGFVGAARSSLLAGV